MQQLLIEFFGDKAVQVVFLAISLDFLLGVLAAFKTHTFRLSYLADVLRNDVLFKTFPFFILHAAAFVADRYDILIPGLALDGLRWSAFSIITAALVGSILKSLVDLGLFDRPVARSRGRRTGDGQDVWDAVAGPDPNAELTVSRT